MRKLKPKKKAISWKFKLYMTLLALVVIGVGVFFMTAPGKQVIAWGAQGIHMVKAKSHLSLQQVIVEGHARTHMKSVNAVLNVRQGMPLFDIDLAEKQAAVAELPWIETVRVERYLPDKLVIKVTEKTPIAIWQNHKKYWPIDTNGKVIRDNKTIIAHVLLVVGADAPEHTPELMKSLAAFPEINAHVKSAQRVGNRRWNLMLKDAENGLVVYLPETDIHDALARLQDAHKENAIFERDLKVVDLRFPDRLIVKTGSAE